MPNLTVVGARLPLQAASCGAACIVLCAGRRATPSACILPLCGHPYHRAARMLRRAARFLRFAPRLLRFTARSHSVAPAMLPYGVAGASSLAQSW